MPDKIEMAKAYVQIVPSADGIAREIINDGSTPIASTKCESGEPRHDLLRGYVLRPDHAALRAVKNKHSAFIAGCLFFACIVLTERL